MAGNTRNILVGAAAVFLSTATTQSGLAAATIPTLGTATAITAFNATAAWTDVGYTTNGLEMSYEPNYGEVAVDQLLDAARLFKQSMRVMVKTEFSEATLGNLFVIMNQSAGYSAVGDAATGTGGTVSNPTAGLEIQGGALGDYPVERSLAAVGQAPRPVSGNAERLYYASRVMSISASSHGLKRDDATTFPVEFRLLPVASSSNAYGKIVDRTYT
jgi:hypothetical protein